MRKDCGGHSEICVFETGLGMISVYFPPIASGGYNVCWRRATPFLQTLICIVANLILQDKFKYIIVGFVFYRIFE
jgi:hypothetical protein